MLFASFVALAAGLFLVAGILGAGEGSGGGRRANHLAGESSPYLLQHAGNPVDWYPWGGAAFERAGREDKPVFLSVGYSTCHWCHVMAHESFEDEEVARFLNEHFVCIKVDREERPDVDQQYMLATQLVARRGGWPNSVFLTPDGRPFFAGTYYPREAFLQLLRALAEAWEHERPQVEAQADRLAGAIRQIGGLLGRGGEGIPGPSAVDDAVASFRSAFDWEHGGVGRSPKFPPHGMLALLAFRLEEDRDGDELAMFTRTLDAMAAGGVYDHLGGGFHRYSTDAVWLLPHFEKMLYDNAQLVAAYAEGYRFAGKADYARVVAETFAWITGEMTDPGGGFYSALDADSAGREGKFYVWTRDEIDAVLGEEDGRVFAEAYGVRAGGNFREEASGEPTGANVLHLPEPIRDDARARRLAAMRARLLAARGRRVRPGRDDKVIAGWNGLMIGALARAGQQLGEPAYTRAAIRAADFVLRHMQADGQLFRIWRNGKASQPAYLDDYAFLAAGLLDLGEATGEAQWLASARQLADRMIDRFHDAAAGGFYFTADSHDPPIFRAKELGGGGNTPSANGVAADALIRLALATGQERYARIAAGTLQAYAELVRSEPHGNEALVLALARWHAAGDRLPGRPGSAVDGASQAEASVREGPVLVEVFADRLAAAPGETLPLAVRLTIDEPWHIYAARPGATPVLPASVTIDPDGPFLLGQITWPAATAVQEAAGQTVNLYDGVVTVHVPVTVREDAAAGPAQLELQVAWQACDDHRCLAPQHQPLPVPVTVLAE